MTGEKFPKNPMYGVQLANVSEADPFLKFLWPEHLQVW